MLKISKLTLRGLSSSSPVADGSFKISADTAFSSVSGFTNTFDCTGGGLGSIFKIIEIKSDRVDRGSESP